MRLLMAYDVMADVVTALSSKLGVPCSTTVPAKRPARFVTVERTGGAMSLGKDEPNLAVQAWASTEADAYTLALCAVEVIDSLWELLPSVCSARAGGVYRFPDPDSRAERYQIDAYLVTRR